MSEPELPTGFAMSLAQKETAIKNFEALSFTEKLVVTEQARCAASKDDMRQLVTSLAKR